MITTTEAAKLADELKTAGKTHSKIARELARQGYVSMKTGKPLSDAGISGLVSKYRDGYKFADLKLTKYANSRGKYLPRPGRTIYGNPALSVPPPPNAEMVAAARVGTNDLAKEQDARAALTLAAEHLLKALFGVQMKVLLPLDRAFRVTS